jgi:hypothetical protein
MYPYLHPAAREVSSVLNRTNENANILLVEQLGSSHRLLDRAKLALFTKGIRILLGEYIAWILVCVFVRLILGYFSLVDTVLAPLSAAILLLSQTIILPSLLALRPSSDMTNHERWIVTALRYTGLYQNNFTQAKNNLLDAIEVYQKWESRFWNIFYLFWGGAFSTFFGHTVHIPFLVEIPAEHFLVVSVVCSTALVFLNLIFLSAPLHWLKMVQRYWPDEKAGAVPQ